MKLRVESVEEVEDQLQRRLRRRAEATVLRAALAVEVADVRHY
jgi:hypothetical protein